MIELNDWINKNSFPKSVAKSVADKSIICVVV